MAMKSAVGEFGIALLALVLPADRNVVTHAISQFERVSAGCGVVINANCPGFIHDAFFDD